MPARPPTLVRRPPSRPAPRPLHLLRHPLLAPAIAVLVALASIALGTLATPATVVAWTAEEGFIERSTVILYFFAGLAVAGDREQLRPPVWLAAAALLAAAAARELDWHKAFTGGSVLKLSYYLGPAPLRHKLVALAILACVGMAAAYLARRFARAVWQGLRARDAVAFTAATFFVCLVVSKITDRSLTVLEQDWHLNFSAHARALQLAIEELLELELPVLVLLGLVQLRLSRADAGLLSPPGTATGRTPPPAVATAPPAPAAHRAPASPPPG